MYYLITYIGGFVLKIGKNRDCIISPGIKRRGLLSIFEFTLLVEPGMRAGHVFQKIF